MASLDRYLQTQAGQDVRRKANAVFIMAAAAAPSAVLGYYTLCATALQPQHIPEQLHKSLPRYPLIAATLIGRLAVAQSHQGQGLGRILLADAVERARNNAATIGSSMIVVDALDDKAAGFYAAHGFTRLPDSQRLILPMQRAVG